MKKFLADQKYSATFYKFFEKQEIDLNINHMISYFYQYHEFLRKSHINYSRKRCTNIPQSLSDVEILSLIHAQLAAQTMFNNMFHVQKNQCHFKYWKLQSGSIISVFD